MSSGVAEVVKTVGRSGRVRSRLSRIAQAFRNFFQKGIDDSVKGGVKSGSTKVAEAQHLLDDIGGITDTADDEVMEVMLKQGVSSQQPKTLSVCLNDQDAFPGTANDEW